MSEQKSVKVIAEAGVNHNGSIKMACELIDAAAEAGADIAKFQTFKAENLVTLFAPKAEYQTQTTDKAESQLEMLRKLELSVADHEALIAHCKKRGIQFLSTPFDFESLDLLLNRFGLELIKVPSGEITNAPFLLEIARSGRPIILSTGMSTLEEVREALSVIAYGLTQTTEPPGRAAFQKAYAMGRAHLAKKVTLLHCTTEYPAPFEEVNLRAMHTLQSAFELPVGLSDHSVGIAVPVAAVALGAAVIEKHFTLDRNLPGPDHRASLEPGELKEMVTSIRQIELALGSPEKAPTISEQKNRSMARKSLVAADNIKAGERFSEEKLALKRPGTGASPFEYWNYLGRIAKRDYKKDEALD